MIFTDNDLLNFIFDAHRHTYAAPFEVKQKYRVDVPLNPEHTEYEYTRGLWRYRDSYAGWKQAPGEEKIFFQDKYIWRMSYQGQVDGSKSKEDIDEIYAFLKSALMRNTFAEPYRGAREYTDGRFTYQFNYEGDLAYLCGREEIFENGKRVYFQDIHACKVLF